MKLEIGLIALAFMGGMTLEASLQEKQEGEAPAQGANPMEDPEMMAAMMEQAAVKKQWFDTDTRNAKQLHAGNRLVVAAAAIGPKHGEGRPHAQ